MSSMLRYVSALATALHTQYFKLTIITTACSAVSFKANRQQRSPRRWGTFSINEGRTGRCARVVCWDKSTNETTVSKVALGTKGAVLSHDVIPGVQPSVDGYEYELCEAIVKAYPPFQEACRKRGLDPEHICVDAWCPGWFGPEDNPSRRLVWPAIYVREPGDDNMYVMHADTANYILLYTIIIFYKKYMHYTGIYCSAYCALLKYTSVLHDSAHSVHADIVAALLQITCIQRAGTSHEQYSRPVEGIEMRIDIQLERVISFKDVKMRPVPGRDPLDNYVQAKDMRAALKPISITQPEGPTFEVNDYMVKWQNWQFRVGFSPREGCTLHCVSFKDTSKGGVRRPVAYRLSFAEMVVPYGDPKAPHYLKNAFDGGEDGLGKNAHSLVNGCDCLGHIHYFDAHIGDFFGGSETIESAICLHEEDAGLGWKHVDWRTGHTELRRRRRLVVSFMCTVANYEYGFSYHLYQDGSIEFDVKLTGVISTGALAPGETYKYDGLRNNVIEADNETETAGPHNPHNNAFFSKETPLTSELKAVRDNDAAKARTWKIKSTSTRNRGGALTSYKLVPTSSLKPMARDEAKFLIRAGWLKHHLWVTPYKQGENYPGGAYPNQAPAADGLEKWTKQDRTLVDTDVVLWHCFGVHHVPRCNMTSSASLTMCIKYTACTSAYYVLLEVVHDVHVQRCAQVHHVCTVQQYYDDLAPNCVHLCVLEIVVTLVYFL
eukprot:8759-Heterococcus_DN1.PRE.2